MNELKIGGEVTTLPQLEYLPCGSVVRTAMATVAQKVFRSVFSSDTWATIGSEDEHLSGDLTDFPMTVLWIGGGDS